MVTSTPDLSVVIPARNEAANLPLTLPALSQALSDAGIVTEIIVVNDHSTDATAEVLTHLSQTVHGVRSMENPGLSGFGRAIQVGLGAFRGPAVAIFMADMSDDPADLIRFYETWKASGVDAVFGTRWSSGGSTHDYPWPKRILNRFFNTSVRLIFRTDYDDTTNAFKLYSRQTIEGCMPILSPHFNLTLELPLKCHIRGFSYQVVPNSWTNRRHGISKLKIQEMGSRYFFILLYCWLERIFVRQDYAKPTNP